MSEYILLEDFLDFKELISIRYLKKDTQEDWYKVRLSVDVRVSQYYLLRTILELIMRGVNRRTIMYILKLTQDAYSQLLFKLKQIVKMPEETTKALRKNKEIVEQRFNEYYNE